VTPEYRGTGVADAVLGALLDHARAHELDVVRLETGDKQRAAIAFYRRHGFVEIPRFGPYLASETSLCMQRRLLEHGSENARH
jgi:putative acetyltransferase